MNVNKLKAKMVECEVSGEVVAKSLGIAKSTFYRKLRGSFLIKEANDIANILGLTPSEAADIFFNQ